MCVLYVSFGSKVRLRTFGCVAMGYFNVQIVVILRRVWSEQIASGFSVRFLCFIQAKTLCRHGCMYYLAALVLVCVDVMVKTSA